MSPPQATGDAQSVKKNKNSSFFILYSSFLFVPLQVEYNQELKH